MIDAIENSIEFVGGYTCQALLKDRKTLFAVVRCIEIVGEAAARMSEAQRAISPNIPWLAIIGMRNRLIHAYFDVDVSVVWKTVTVELPALKQELRALL
jgi:uncharacterized protein with HEPN domain